jgi:hypothetical protein
MKTIIYLTDNTLDEEIAKKCREVLLKEAGEIPIISVSQKPVDLGKNICLGEIGRSWMSLYKQQLAGLNEAKTKYISIAEHDVLYTREHFDWMPPRDDVFYYNQNCWFVQWGGNHPELNGMYSTYWGERCALSQLVCSRELLIEAIKERMYMFENGLKAIANAGEPGVAKDLAYAYKLATSGSHVHLSGLMEKHLTKFSAETFKTKNPNLDVRHGSNFTGPKRGKNRTFILPFWGEFKNVIKVND